MLGIVNKILKLKFMFGIYFCNSLFNHKTEANLGHFFSISYEMQKKQLTHLPI